MAVFFRLLSYCFRLDCGTCGCDFIWFVIDSMEFHDGSNIHKEKYGINKIDDCLIISGCPSKFKWNQVFYCLLSSVWVAPFVCLPIMKLNVEFHHVSCLREWLTSLKRGRQFQILSGRRKISIQIDSEWKSLDTSIIHRGMSSKIRIIPDHVLFPMYYY